MVDERGATDAAVAHPSATDAAPVDAPPARRVGAPPARQGCDRAGYRPPPGAKLELVGQQVPGGRAVIDVGLRNVGGVAVCGWSHIATHEWQSDWLTVLYADGHKYHHASRPIALDDDRDKSAPVSVLLEPGQAVWHQIDVDAWARRSRNGSEPLPAGSLYTQVVYDTSGETQGWAGRLTSASFGLGVR